MSQVVDTKVVEMQFDNSKFEKNIEVSLNSLKFLNKNIEDAGKNRGSLDELAKASDQVGISFDNMNMKSRISLNLFDMLAGVGTKAFNRISDAVAGLALNMANSLSGMQAMRDGFAEYELKMGSVQTILAGAKIIDPNTGRELKDEAERLAVVNQKLEDLNAYSDRTIYSFKDMTSNIGKFTNAGVNLDDAVDAIQGVANVAAISGANAGEASRAMYNFAQALSSGYVKLIDWKSIENANMATVGFKEELLKTALAIGTVRKEGDKYVTTTTDANGKISEAFDATMMFNDSLSHQWMTTDVLTTTLKKYTDESTELGKKAFAAATEVKTFSQMIDTLKESLGSGWAQSFEIIFGDFREAKALWTEVNNAIEGILSPIGETRNAILKIWKEDGGRDAVIQSFRNLGEAVSNLLAPVKELWKALTPNVSHTGQGLAKISKGIEKLTGLVAKGASVIGKALAFVLKPVIFVGNTASKYLMKLFGLAQKFSSKVSERLSSVGKAVKSFGGTIGKAFNKHITARVESFGKSISGTFENLKKRIKDSKAINTFVKAFKDLRDTIHDLFGRVIAHATSYASRFSTYMGKLWNAITPLVSSAFKTAIKTLSDILLPRFQKALGWVTDKLEALKRIISKVDIKNSGLYKGLSSLPDKIKELAGNKTFNSIFTGIKNFGSDAVSHLSEKFSALKSNIEAIKMPGGLKDVFDNIKNFIKSIFGEDSVQDPLAGTLAEAAEATEKIANEGSGQKLTAFQKFLEGISGAFEWLKNAAGLALGAIKDFVNFVVTNTPKALKAFYNFLAGEDGILQMSDLTDIFYTISEAFGTIFTSLGFNKMGDAAKGISDAFGDLTESITTFLKRTSNKMQMTALRDFAIAVGVLTVSLYLLSKIPADKLLIASGAIVALGFALTKFFGMVSTGNMDISKTVGNLSIAALLLSIGGAMIAVAASVGILVLALKAFPGVIKQYNNLGDEFRSGMDRVKEVLEQIFQYLDHAASSKYSFRSAMALLGLVASLSMLRKTIIKFANKKTGDAMADGLERIQEVLELLGSFLSQISIASFSFINVGIDFDTLGMAAMIWALGNMIKKITPAIQELAKLQPSEYRMAFKSLDSIFFEFGAFLAGMSLMSKFTGTGLGQWLGIAANVTLLASAIGSIVSSLDALTKLISKDSKSFGLAFLALEGIFISFGALLAVIGLLKPKASVATLFGLSVAIGVLTACVFALVPLAHSHPKALMGSVIALGALMGALGGTLLLVGKASGKTTIGDIVKLIGITFSMITLASALRRLSKTGGSAGSIAASGAAIAGAVLSMAGAIKLMNGVHIAPTVLIGLGILAAAIWGVAYAIAAFKGSAGGMVEGAKTVDDAGEEIKDSIANLNIEADAFSGLFKELGPALKNAVGDINIGEAFRGMIETIKSDAKNWAQDFIDIGTNLIDGLSSAISNPSNVEKVKQSFIALGKALLESFKLFFGIHSPSTVMAEQGGFIIDGLVQGLMEFPSKLAGWVSSIGTFILDGIHSIFDGAKEKGRALADSIGAGIQNGKAAVSKKASELGNAALKKVGKAKEWAGEALKSANSFGNKLKNSRSPIGKAAGTMIVGATNAIKGLGSIFHKSSSDATAKFTSSLNAGKGPAKSAAAAIVAGAKSAFNGLTSSFKSYGTDAANGFKNGISNMISSIAAKAREMVRAAKNAAKSEQNSNSPSKDFMEYGGWAAEGYAIGMTNRKSSKLIEKNARAMVDTAKNAASGDSLGVSSLYLDSNPAMSSLAYAMSQISDAWNEDMDSSVTIRPVVDMTNLHHSASAISAMFGDRRIGASMDVVGSAQNDFNSTMNSRNNAMSLKSIDKLSSKIDSMTSTMNARSLNVYNTIDGAADPSAFADELVRNFRLNARTV